MTRYAKRVDANQSSIYEGLRALGYLVEDWSMCGNGVPDCSVLIDADKKISLFLEIKDGDKAPSKQKLTTCEKYWAKYHGFNTRTVNSLESALLAIEEFKKMWE